MTWGLFKAAATWSRALPLAAMVALCLLLSPVGGVATGAAPGEAAHLGVGTCAGSTCHGRQEPTGAIVRQDEILRWQDPASPAGSHSRAWRVLAEPRGRAIAAKLGITDPQKSAQCIACHGDPAAPHSPAVRLSDGVNCETCHGGAQNWLASHYAMGTSHARNVALGMVALDRAEVRARVCLDCHFGSAKPGQFVSHTLMAAGHPRISFELDLFSTLQQHWNADKDYTQRKGAPSDVKVWAVGQAEAVSRALGLFVQPGLGQMGAFPEFYFFDCQTCHRRISDAASYRPTAERNPARPAPPGFPGFQDENMIMLSAAAAVAAPEAGRRFDAAARAFHGALAAGRGETLAAAQRLREAATALSEALARAPLGRAQTFAMLDRIAATATTERFTDYEASVQAVMAVDTLLAALVEEGAVAKGQAAAIRPDVDRAYAAVRDANGFDGPGFRRAIASAAGAVRRLR